MLTEREKRFLIRVIDEWERLKGSLPGGCDRNYYEEEIIEGIRTKLEADNDKQSRHSGTGN